MFLVGLTGGIASGKSSVSHMLKLLNCEVIDADRVAREVVEPGKPAWRKLVKNFGDDILLSTGELDRTKLGNLENTVPELSTYEGRVHGFFNCNGTADSNIKIFSPNGCWKGHRFVVLDIPLLFESGVFAPFMNKIIVVYCDPDTQLIRLMNRNEYTEEQARQRIAAQIPLNEKCQWATHVVDNSGTSAETLRQVETIHKELTSSWAFLRLRIAFAMIVSGIALACYWVVQLIWWNR